MAWTRGELIVRRELVDGEPWFAYAGYTVFDDPELLAIYVPEGSPFGFPKGEWPTADGRHPADGRSAGWQGHGSLQLHRPQDAYAVWVLWNDTPPNDWSCWCVNLQAPLRRTGIGFDTEDHGLVVVIGPDGKCLVEGEADVDDAVRLGRLTADTAAEARRTADEVVAMVEAGNQWWADLWQRWRPDRDWVAPAELPAGWDQPELPTDA